MMTEKEVFERFIEGIKMARASAKLLAMARQSEEWLAVEQILMRIAQNADQIGAKRRTKPTLLRAVN